MTETQEQDMPEFDSFWESAWAWTVKKLHEVTEVKEPEDDTDY